MREARWEQQGLDKEIRTPVREPQAVRRSRPEAIPDVKSNGMVQRRIGRSLFSLQVQPSLLLPCSGIRLQRKHNQNKYLFAPPSRRFLNYRVGPPGLCACTTAHSPASCSEVRGQNARRGDNCRRQPIEEVRKALTTSTSQSGLSDHSSPPSQISKSATFFPGSLFGSRSILYFPRGSNPQVSALWINRVVCLGHNKIRLFKDSIWNSVTLTGKYQHSQSIAYPVASLPVPPSCKPERVDPTSPWQHSYSCSD